VQGTAGIGTAHRTSHIALTPHRLWAGLALLLVSWWMAWFGPPPFSYYTFFPLWLGYILAIDGLTARRTGTSLFSRSPRHLAILFAFSVPLWWLFELANHFLNNWRYLLPYPYDFVTFTLVASLSFSTVMPAIFVTAEILRTFSPFAPPRHWIRLNPDNRRMAVISLCGLAIFVLSLAIPRFLFPLVWIGLFLALDPINDRLGNPSIVSQVRRGRWDTVIVLFAAGLTCGILWELWNVHSMPKWVYDVPFVDHPKLFEMPIVGYGGYLPFALEVFAVWSFLSGLLPRQTEGWLRFTGPYGESECGTL
jgi:hypothetical protein